jgi:hypothetical protein
MQADGFAGTTRQTCHHIAVPEADDEWEKLEKKYVEMNRRSSNFVLNKIVAAPHRPTTTSANK